MNERIKALRKELGLTQQQFADLMKVKRNTVATYEMGRSIPSDSAIALICEKCNVNENWLRTGNGKMFKKVSRNDHLANWFGTILQEPDESLNLLSRLDESEWEAMEQKALFLVNEKESQ
jgi:transcriptional regulator with XRE-family HTH domain